MTDTTLPSGSSRASATGNHLYRLVWKWHFLASLFVLPFMLMLSLTGGIYLYKPQIEAWLYADAINVTPMSVSASYQDQLDAIDNAVGLTRVRGITQYDDPTRSTLVEFDDATKTRSFAWVNPYTAEVLKVAERDAMPMRMLRKFHGELLLGSFGTKFVETSAHWAIVMFATGLYLWWPRGQRSLAKAVSLPRGSGRAWWRETHLFTGMLATVLIVPIIITGLPWTDVWGGGLSYVQEQTGQKSKSLRFGGDVPNSTQSEGTPITPREVFDIAKSEGLIAPLEMRPARNAEASIWVRSATTDRAQQTELIVDQYSGAVLKRHDFADNPPVAQAVSYGISFHQGEAYGTANLIQNTIAALLGVVLSISGFVAWWMRRPSGSLGVPAAPDAALSGGMVALIIGLAILFPLMGATLIVALILDWLLFQRLGWFRAAKA